MDVPFFLVGGRCIGIGTGSIVKPVHDSPQTVPDYRHSECQSRNCKCIRSTKCCFLDNLGVELYSFKFLCGHVFSESGQWPLQNDFEGVIFEIEPEIERAKRALLQAGARGALLAGSGSSVFGIFDDEAAEIAPLTI